MADAGDLRRRRARQRQPLQPVARPAAEPAHRRAPRPTRRRASSCSARCRRWSAAAPSTGRAGCRASPPNDFRLRTDRRRPARHHAGRLADHLRRARAVLRQGRMGVRRLRPGRRQRVRGRRAAAATRARRCRCRATREKFHQGCANLGWNSFPTPQAALSRPHNGRPATVISAFAQQHGDPTGTRSSALNVFVPDAVKTGRYDLRPDSLRPRAGAGRPGPGQGRGLRGCRRRHGRAGGRSLHPRLRRGRVRAPAAPVQVRPLPQRARQRQRPGRAQRHLPRVQRRGRPVRRPDLRLGRRRLCQRQHVPVLRARRVAAASSAAATSPPPASASRCRSTGACPAARPGVPRPSRSTGTISTTAWRSPWCVHDMPQHDNRVELDDEVVDAWGLPVARITLQPHDNDLSHGQVPDRPQRRDPRGGRRQRASRRSISTGSPATAPTSTAPPGWATTRPRRCSTAWCRAHEVDNLYVVDGGPFPTGTGANPTLTIMANAWRVAEHIVDARA